MHHPTDRIAHTTTFVTPVMEHWREREIAQWVHPMKDRSDDPSHHERTLVILKAVKDSHRTVGVCGTMEASVAVLTPGRASSDWSTSVTSSTVAVTSSTAGCQDTQTAGPETS